MEQEQEQGFDGMLRMPGSTSKCAEGPFASQARLHQSPSHGSLRLALHTLPQRLVSVPTRPNQGCPID
jgi:hypothetical protein